MLEELERNLKKLDGKTITIKAQGEYPVKARTKVQAVAHYQNDGTKYITPAKFVETSEQRNFRKWNEELAKGIWAFILDATDRRLQQSANVVAKDIGKAVNRIDTRRLKKSMRAFLSK